MENPFLQINKSNKKLKLILTGLGIALVATFVFAHSMVGTVSGLQNVIEKFNLGESEKVKKLEDELNKKTEELKKLTMTKEIIKEHILLSNRSVSVSTADKYAHMIIKESNRRGVPPYIQAALLKSESSFNSNARHDIKNVIGMGGIYWNVWKHDLIKENIAHKKEDLWNPYTNIKASAYILSVYMKTNKNNTFEALARYKGYCDLGKSQARVVLAMAKQIRNTNII